MCLEAMYNHMKRAMVDATAVGSGGHGKFSTFFFIFLQWYFRVIHCMLIQPKPLVASGNSLAYGQSWRASQAEKSENI